MGRHRPSSPARFSVPASEAWPPPTTSHPHRVELAVSEWTADITTSEPTPTARPLTTLGATGFVDFDMVESVHETSDRMDMVGR